MDTAQALKLERLRAYAQSRLQSARCDLSLSDQQKREEIAAIRSEHARRVQAIRENGEEFSWL